MVLKSEDDGDPTDEEIAERVAAEIAKEAEVPGENKSVEERLAEVETQLAAEQTARKAAEEKLAKAEKSELSDEQRFAKAIEGLPSESQEVLKAERSARLAAEAQVSEAVSIAKAERDLRIDEEYVAKAKDLAALPAKPTDLGPVLRSIDEKLPKEQAEELNRLLKAADEQVRSSRLFTEIGGAGGSVVGGDVVEKIESAATELRKADPNLSPEAAFVKAVDLNPTLKADYERHIREQEAS